MKIQGYQKSRTDGQVRVAATVSWEDQQRPPREVYIETSERFEADINPSPEAFLLAVAMPAMEHGERRILVDGQLCPDLRNGVTTAMKIFSKWYPRKGLVPPSIESTEGFTPARGPSEARTASFLSGGVDALATLRTNHLDHGVGSPGRVVDCFFVHGFDIGGYHELDRNRANSDTAIASLSTLEEHAGINLIPVTTNMRHVDDNDNLFFQTTYGSNLASVAHSFGRRISMALIASGSGVDDLGPIGSHPMIDGNYGSAGLRIRHDGLRFSRLEKVGLISQWPEGLRTLRACFDAFRPASDLNCGRCEKCLRTMTELLVHGKLDQCPTYPQEDVTTEMLATVEPVSSIPADDSRESILRDAYKSMNVANNYYWREMIEPLRRIGRDDLANVVAAKVTAYDKGMAREREEDMRGWLKKIDRTFFGSKLMRLKSLVR